MTLLFKRRPGLMAGAAAALICCGATIIQPVNAADAGRLQLIDKPFEDAAVKHFQKRFFNRINATVDQREKLSEMIEKRMDETRPLREQLRRRALELKEMMVAAGGGDEQLIAKSHEIRKIRNQLFDVRFESLLQVRALLTPDQRKQISDRISGIMAAGAGRS